MKSLMCIIAEQIEENIQSAGLVKLGSQPVLTSKAVTYQPQQKCWNNFISYLINQQS